MIKAIQRFAETRRIVIQVNGSLNIARGHFFGRPDVNQNDIRIFFEVRCKFFRLHQAGAFFRFTRTTSNHGKNKHNENRPHHHATNLNYFRVAAIPSR